MLDSNWFTHRNTYAISREASSETYGPRVYFPSKKFLIYNSSFQFTFLCNLYFPFHKQKYYFTVYPSLSDLTLRIAVKGLTTALSHWLQVGVCLCRYSMACRVVSYWIDTLVLKLREILISTLLHHPFLFKGKTNASSRSSTYRREFHNQYF